MLIYNPRQTVLVTCRGQVELFGSVKEKSDVLPCHSHLPLSSHPPMYGISVSKNLLACSIIRESRCFAVNFIPFSLVESLKKSVFSSPEFSDKLSGLTEVPCDKIDCFRLKESLGWLECEVVDEKEVGDHVFFFGSVLFSHMERDDHRPFHVDKDIFTTTR